MSTSFHNLLDIKVFSYVLWKSFSIVRKEHVLFSSRCMLSMLRSHLKCSVYTRRLSTQVLRKIIRVYRESLPTGHAVSVCSEFACLTRVPLTDTLHLSVAINMAVANMCSVLLLVSSVFHAPKTPGHIPSLSF